MMNATMILTRSIGRHAANRSSKRMVHIMMCGPHRTTTSADKMILFSSSTRSMNTSTKKTKIEKSKREEPKSLLFWGTSTKGSIPSKEELEAGRGTAAEESKGFFSKGSTAIHSPLEIDVQDAFGIDNETVVVKDINCGPNATAVILSNNTAFTFGKNGNGQLGHSHRNDVLIPTMLNPPDSSPLQHDQISKIKIGSNFTAIVDMNGDLYTCGYNGSTLSEGIGCLGQGYFPEEYLDSPKLVESLVEDGCFVNQVEVGNSHMVVLTTEGEVLTCGSAQWGRIGNLESDDQLFLEPVEMLGSGTDVCQIETGRDFSMALTKKEGVVFTWGKNEKGQCGTGSGLSVEMYAMEPMPVPVEGMLEGRKVVKISAGDSHAAALTDKGELFVWGMGIHHQPDLVVDLAHANIVDVKCGKNVTFALDKDGKVYVIGNAKKTGVLGLGSKQTKSVTPTLLDGLTDKKISFLDVGWNHVACLTNNTASS